MFLLGGCGRFGFDAVTVSDGGSGDSGDAAAACGPSILCDGFESGTLGPAWMTDVQNGSIAVDAIRAHRGKYSVHAHTDAITSSTFDPRATVIGYGGLPISGIVYVRAWAYFAAPHPNTFFDQVLNFSDPAGEGISMGARNGNVVINDYTDVLYAESTAVQLPVGRWTCLGLSIPSGIAGTSRAYIDDVEVTDVALTKATVQPRPDHIYIGLEWVGTVMTQVAVDAWFDDIVIDSAPITCSQ